MIEEVIVGKLDTKALAGAAREHEEKIYDTLFPDNKQITSQEKLNAIRTMMNPKDYPYQQGKKMLDGIRSLYGKKEKDFSKEEQKIWDSIKKEIESYGIGGNLIQVAKNAIANNNHGYEIEIKAGPMIKKWAEDYAQKNKLKVHKIISTEGLTNRYDYYLEFEDENGNRILSDGEGLRFEVKSDLNNFHVTWLDTSKDQYGIQYKVFNDLRKTINDAIRNKNIEYNISDFNSSYLKSDSLGDVNKYDVSVNIMIPLKESEIIKWANELLYAKFNNNYPLFVNRKQPPKLCSDVLDDLSFKANTVFTTDFDITMDYEMHEDGIYGEFERSTGYLDTYDNEKLEKEEVINGIKEQITRAVNNTSKFATLDIWYGKPNKNKN